MLRLLGCLRSSSCCWEPRSFANLTQFSEALGQGSRSSVSNHQQRMSKNCARKLTKNVQDFCPPVYQGFRNHVDEVPGSLCRIISHLQLSISDNQESLLLGIYQQRKIKGEPRFKKGLLKNNFTANYFKLKLTYLSSSSSAVSNSEPII